MDDAKAIALYLVDLVEDGAVAGGHPVRIVRDVVDASLGLRGGRVALRLHCDGIANALGESRRGHE